MSVKNLKVGDYFRLRGDGGAIYQCTAIKVIHGSVRVNGACGSVCSVEDAYLDDVFPGEAPSDVEIAVVSMLEPGHPVRDNIERLIGRPLRGAS